MDESWNDLMLNPQAILGLYDIPPPLLDVEVTSIVLGPESALMSVSLILPRFPDRPPRRWPSSDNEASMTIQFIDVSELTLAGWRGINASVRLAIHRGEAGTLVVTATSDGLNFGLQCGWASVDRINGYRSSHPSGTSSESVPAT